MNQNQSGYYTTNNLSSHASLLLSASPTIINSPLQNNSNNPNSSPVSSTPIAPPMRRHPSIPLLITATTNLADNDSHLNLDSPPNFDLTEPCYINFKKPQNEMFKKLDGKIQKIVAAHSNLNKLYALNDFSSLGVGPKRPFELPPQLPPPPPWVPKVAAEYGGQWNDDPVRLTPEPPQPATGPSTHSNWTHFRPTLFDTKRMTRPSPSLSHDSTSSASHNPLHKTSNLTIDSAISKLHQRRQKQLNQKSPRPTSDMRSPGRPTPCSSLSPSEEAPSHGNPKTNPPSFYILAQKIKETIEARCSNRAEPGILTDAEKVKVQEDLIALLKKEITSVTKQANLKFSPTTSPKRSAEQRAFLLKSSPQTLFNTIRHETSLLLNRRDQESRNSLSLLSDQQKFNRQNTHENYTIRRQPIKLQQTMKVVVQPTEFQQVLKSELKESSENSLTKINEPTSRGPLLTYQVIKSKIRLFQERNQICLGKSNRFSSSPDSKLGFGTKKKSGLKSLDKIVDRLQAKCCPSPSPGCESPPQALQKTASLQQQILYSSASLQSSRGTHHLSAPTPIPVFRPPLSSAGLRIGNYLEKECPQPTTERLTIEQFAKSLNLVRSNDAALQRRQEQLLQSESKWRHNPINSRPLRLRRLRGERIQMPASASYRATSKARSPKVSTLEEAKEDASYLEVVRRNLFN